MTIINYDKTYFAIAEDLLGVVSSAISGFFFLENDEGKVTTVLGLLIEWPFNVFDLAVLLEVLAELFLGMIGWETTNEHLLVFAGLGWLDLALLVLDLLLTLLKSVLAGFGGGELDEGKATGTAGGAIDLDLGLGHFSKLSEVRLEVFIGYFCGNSSDKDLSENRIIININ